MKVLKLIDNNLMSLRNGKKDFANFGLVGLQPKPRCKPKSIDTNKRKKRKSDKLLTREEELTLENEALHYYQN